jgi:hypothetical protein
MPGTSNQIKSPNRGLAEMSRIVFNAPMSESFSTSRPALRKPEGLSCLDYQYIQTFLVHHCWFLQTTLHSSILLQ